jgi:hypothetical protein
LEPLARELEGLYIHGQEVFIKKEVDSTSPNDAVKLSIPLSVSSSRKERQNKTENTGSKLMR